ncbi:small secreted hydrophilic protein [Streptomyces sp. NPDC056716]|uniref:small secreted hydrophilic protein n=1 Tax=unclassified Streptomyces TaxID=2593676 RepID=UPI0036958FFE
MVFSHRLAALAAVVVIPLGIAATSFVLTDRPESPEVPAKVELDSGSPTASPDRPGPTPSDEVVSPPPATDAPGAPIDPADPTSTPTDPPPAPPGGTGQTSGSNDDDGSEPAGPGAGDDDGADDDGPGGDDG